MQKGLITQLVRTSLGSSLKADGKGTWTDFQQKLLCFKVWHPFYSLFFFFFVSNPCLSVPGRVELWSSSRWFGIAPLGLANTVEMFSIHQGQIAATSHYSLTAGEVLEEHLSGLNTSAVWPWDTAVTMCLYELHTPHKNQSTRWLVAKQRQLETKYQNQQAFCWAPGSHSPPCLRISVLCGSSHLLKSHSPKLGRSWKGPLHYKWLGGNRKQLKLPSVKSHHCTNIKNIPQMWQTS